MNPQNMTKPKVMIVILNYQTYELTIDLLDQLKSLNYENYDIVIIDNCSPNESAEILKAKREEYGYELIENSVNAGYAAGNNIGIRYAIQHGYEYSWVLNNDLKITDHDILKKLVDAAESRDDIAWTGPEIVDIDGYKTAPYCEQPTAWTMTLGLKSARDRRQRDIGKSGDVYRLYGCCILLKNSYMKAVDCMDERTFLYWEEDILAERLKKVGGKAYYLADTSIIHLESMTVNKAQGKKSIKKLRIVLKSMDIYLKDYLNYGVLTRFFCKAFRVAIFMLKG